MLLTGKTAIVTGAGSPRGIGRATARLFAEHGARVAVVDIDAAAAAAAARALGDGHLGIGCDVADAGACRDAVARAADAFGAIDCLVNNAGIAQPLRILDVTPAHYDAVLDVSLRGTLQMSQAVIPRMRRRRSGSIACMSSVAAQRGGGIFGGPHYAAAKAGVLGLAKAMARELGPDGIRVNAVTPGVIETDIFDGQLTEERRRAILAGVPLGRIGAAEDVAGVFLFLASDLSAYVTGAVLDVNGGMHIH